MPLESWKGGSLVGYSIFAILENLTYLAAVNR